MVAAIGSVVVARAGTDPGRPAKFTSHDDQRLIKPTRGGKIIEQGDFANGTITSIDGLRVDYTKGWGLVRASNTSPALTLRFEAESPEALEKIQHIFKRELLKVNSTLAIPF